MLTGKGLKGDIWGGVTAGVVALPLALAFGVASGMGAIAGLYGAIVVGFFAALFGGTPSQISGPTGPMTVAMAATVVEFEAAFPGQGLVLSFTAVMLAGLMQVALGLLKMGRYITMVPLPVISGFMSGIGLIIILLQLAPLLGHVSQGSVLASVLALPDLLAAIHRPSLILGAAVLLITLIYPARLARLMPASLFALLMGVLLYKLALPDSGVSVIGNIPTGLPELIIPHFEPQMLTAMLMAAAVLALLGSVDSLLTSLVADTMTRSHHNSDRELIGQGVGNLFAGMVGGLPGAGATMRTVVNIKAGGYSPRSGIIHALLLLVLVLGAAPIAQEIPQAVLAGLLIKVGLDIIDWPFLLRLGSVPMFVRALMLLVLGLTVFVDLITAVLVGVFVANVYTLKRLAEVQTRQTRVAGADPAWHDGLTPDESVLLRQADGQLLLVRFSGPVSYAAARDINRKIESHSNYSKILLDFTEVPLIDISTALAIEQIVERGQQLGRSVILVGVQDNVEQVFEKLGLLARVPEHRQFGSRAEALNAAWVSLQEARGYQPGLHAGPHSGSEIPQ